MEQRIPNRNGIRNSFRKAFAAESQPIQPGKTDGRVVACSPLQSSFAGWVCHFRAIRVRALTANLFQQCDLPGMIHRMLSGALEEAVEIVGSAGHGLFQTVIAKCLDCFYQFQVGSKQ